MKDLYQMFGTEKRDEVDGVWIDYGTSRVKIARAGGKKY